MAESRVERLDVLVVGGIFREVLERRSEAPHVRIGGSALTAGIAAARMGTSVCIASFVGSEDDGVVRTLLDHAGVRGELVVLPGASGIFVYPVDADDSLPRPLYRPGETSPRAFARLPPAKVLLLFGMPDFDAPSDPAVVEAAGAAAVLLWDRQGWLSRTRDASTAGALPASNRVLLANVDEAIDEGILDARDGTVALPSGFSSAVFKDGVRGALVVGPSGAAEVPAYPTVVRNNVGSGDIFAGVLAAELARAAELDGAAKLASAATAALLETGETIAPPDFRQLADAVLRRPGSLDWR